MQQNTPDPRRAENRRASKWRAMDWLRVESVRKRQRACQLKAAGDTVGMRASETHGYGFAGLQSCGSITCPHCGPKIAAHRRAELVTATTNARQAGYRQFFGTLTIRHHAGQSADAVMDAVSAGWRAVTGDRRWKDERTTWGLAGFVRVFETKYGRNGWHTHCHFLLFVRPSETHDLDLAVFGDDYLREQLFVGMFSRWAVAVQAEGFAAPLPIAQDFHEVLADDGHKLAEYLAKQAGAEAPHEMSETRMAWEMSSHGTKSARNYASGFEMRSVLELAVEGDERAAAVWNEYELAMQGRRTIAWSRGLRDELGVGAELTDDEVAAEDAGDDTLVSIDRGSWRRIAKRSGFRFRALQTLADHGPAHTVAWLHDLGVSAWVGPPPDLDAAERLY